MVEIGHYRYVRPKKKRCHEESIGYPRQAVGGSETRGEGTGNTAGPASEDTCSSYGRWGGDQTGAGNAESGRHGVLGSDRFRGSDNRSELLLVMSDEVRTQGKGSAKIKGAFGPTVSTDLCMFLWVW